MRVRERCGAWLSPFGRGAQPWRMEPPQVHARECLQDLPYALAGSRFHRRCGLSDGLPATVPLPACSIGHAAGRGTLPATCAIAKGIGLRGLPANAIALAFPPRASEMAGQGSMRLVAFDEMQPEKSGLRKPYAAYDRWLKAAGPGQAYRKDARRRARLPQDRHHLRRLWRGRGGRAADPLRHRAAHHLRLRMAPADARHRAARPGAQRLPRRHLPSPGDPARRPRAEGADRRQRGVPARDDRRAPAGRRLHPHHRRRHRAHRRERVLRARGQCAHAIRRLLHAGEPRDDDAALPGAVPAGQGAAGRELSAAAAPVAGRGAARKSAQGADASRC